LFFNAIAALFERLERPRAKQPFDGRFLNFHGQDSFFAVTGGWP
jgi:hypothetical protein